MFGKKKFVLAAAICSLLEEVRLSIEVLNGSPMRFKHIEFDKNLISGNGAIYVNDEEIPLAFTKSPGREIYFDLRLGETWHVARFDSRKRVRIALRRDLSAKWMVGTSFADRWEEPLRILPPIEE